MPKKRLRDIRFFEGSLKNTFVYCQRIDCVFGFDTMRSSVKHCRRSDIVLNSCGTCSVYKKREKF